MSGRGKALIPRIAALTGIDAVVFSALGVAGAHFGVIAPRIGFLVFGISLLVGSLLALTLGALGLVVAPDGRRTSLIGVVCGAAGLFLLAILLMPVLDTPMIHDVTTNPDDPPHFQAIADLQDNAGRDLSYPHGDGDVTAQQRRAYGDLETLRLDKSPSEALEAARQAAEALGWVIVAVDEEAGIVEAYDTSKFFRFIDDVVVRIRVDGTGSEVDVRSTSRVGKSDLGVNARRVRVFLDQLV